MSEIEETNIENTAPEVTPEAPRNEAQKKSKSMTKVYLGSLIFVLIVILGVLFLLEKEGRSSTNLFAPIIEKQEANKVVAIVNRDEIINSELDTSIEQFQQIATAQGMDITDTNVSTEIKSQALDILVNTLLLKQAAAEKGISISDEEVTERLAGITEELGGEEALQERMKELEIEEGQLMSDVRDELLIQTLLDGLFSEEDSEVSDEEISAMYEAAGGEEAGLPPLEEAKNSIKDQIVANKEQAVIDEYLAGLRGKAEIEIMNE